MTRTRAPWAATTSWIRSGSGTSTTTASASSVPVNPDSKTPIDSSGSITLDGNADTFPDALALNKLLLNSPRDSKLLREAMGPLCGKPLGYLRRCGVDRGGDQRVSSRQPQCPQPDRRGRHVENLPIPLPRYRRGVAMKKDRFSRRAFLKAMGMARGFSPFSARSARVVRRPPDFPHGSFRSTGPTVPCRRISSRRARPGPTCDAAAHPAAACAVELEGAVDARGEDPDEPYRLRRHARRKPEIRRALFVPDASHWLQRRRRSVARPAIANNLATTANLTNAQLNVGCRPDASSTSWRAAGQKNTPQTDPYKLFTSLFAGQTMPPRR